jgi:hypothetical protein
LIAPFVGHQQTESAELDHILKAGHTQYMKHTHIEGNAPADTKQENTYLRMQRWKHGTPRESNSMTNLTLRFRDPIVAQLFTTFCLSHKHGELSHHRDMEYDAFVFQIKFNNKTERSKFISDWGECSVERN